MMYFVFVHIIGSPRDTRWDWAFRTTGKTSKSLLFYLLGHPLWLSSQT